MSHDGSPSPMYWVIWSVSESPEFSRFCCVQHGVPVLLIELLVERFSGFQGFISWS